MKMWAPLLKGHNSKSKVQVVRMELDNIELHKVSISEYYWFYVADYNFSVFDNNQFCFLIILQFT